ncbi:cytochrome P450 [Daldinia decipiens]|uniref:cytochrome P450 n=1 Tax=Daldinia decipiens TaxID=326647 RepID=UPI0020C4CF1F|nr:cytochrome P450 [Daldinia decipiens]KAI1656636.1 cytochrome P450 [Daldinia decipiens]
MTTLPFLDSFVKWTYKKYNPAFQATQKSKRDVIVSGGRLIQANSIVIPIFQANHQIKDYWGNTHALNPDCWSDKAANKKSHRLTSTPLGAGPRGCIGYNVALLETKLTITNLDWRYYSEDVVKEPVEYGLGFILIRLLNYYITPSTQENQMT